MRSKRFVAAMRESPEWWFPEALVRGFLAGVPVPLQGFVLMPSSGRRSMALVRIEGRWFKVGVEEASPLG